MTSIQSDETPTPNYQASVEFLERWERGGPWVVVAIIPDPPKKGRKTFTATFGAPTKKELREWLEEQGALKRNLYFTLNRCARSMSDKPERVDIAALSWLHVDLDPRAGEDHAAERARIFEKLRNLPEGIPPPTCVIDSGNGGQAFWRLRVPHLLDGKLEAAIEADRWNKQLELRLGGDACHNIDRIMRLPGTVNWPNANKRAKGRVPALARLVEFNDSQHDLAGFEKAPAVAAPSNGVAAAEVKIDAANVKRFASVDEIPELRDESDGRNAKCRVAIVQGCDPDDPQKSRSEPLRFVCCQMVRAGCSDDAIYSVITDTEFAISASVRDKGAGVERYAVRQIRRAREAVAAEAAEFQGDEKGNLYKNLHNARVAIAKLGVSVEFDEFADRALVAGLPEFGPYLDDAAVTRLRLAIDERFKILFGKEFFVDVVTDMARRNRRHPVREFLDDLAWDGTPRLDRWLSTYMGAKETEYTRAVGALVLVAAVRRVRKPGCKFDEMVVLEGPQGGFKSTALKVLAILEDWFSDDLPLNAKPQQFIEQTVGKWIVEAGELKGMRKGDVDSLKSCLSRQRDRSRMAFGHLPLERARQFVIIGTTNSDRYLKDNTGNRRFWPVRVGEVKIDDLRRDREQLWAEAAAREAAGASIRLDPELYGAASEEQARRRVEDPFVETLGAMLNGAEGKLRAIDAWAIVGVPEGQRTQDHNQRLGDAMRELGWERTKLRFDGVVEHCYAKGDARARWRRVEVLLDDRGRATGVRDGSATDETLGGGERPAGEGER
jgi:predicted P-loop ATPase